MTKIRIGVQVHSQAATYAQHRATWQAVDQLGADTLWNWDHFFPLYGDPDAMHFECWTSLAAMAEVTGRVQIGAMVTCNSYRNPHLLADMARTVDHISGGRLILGIGSGWCQRDYDEYGYDFKTAPERLQDLAAALPVIEDRMTKLNPGPVNGKIPMMIGGGGEKVTLRLVARHAAMWNYLGTPEEVGAKSRILDDWCVKLGRNQAEIERSVLFTDHAMIDRADDYVANGITHLLWGCQAAEFDPEPVQKLLAWRDARNAG